MTKEKVIEVFKTSKDSWKVDCTNTNLLTIQYKYFASELNAGSTFMDDVQLYVNPVNCLVYNLLNQDSYCEVELEIPKDFEIACGTKFEKNKAKFKDYHEMVDTPFIASASLTHLEFKTRNVQFHLWFQGDVKLDEERIIEDVKAYTDEQINNF